LAQVKKFGEAKSPWYVGFVDPNGKRRAKSCGVGFLAKKTAERMAAKLAGQLLLGEYDSPQKKKWAEFRRDYEKHIAGKAPKTIITVETCLDTFERITKPQLVSAITTRTIDDFVQVRREEAGKKKGSKISPASLNRDLRHLKAALMVAKDWGILSAMPKVRMVAQPAKIVRDIEPEHFAAIYKACEVARMPISPNIDPAAWWRALLVFGYFTGWRIGSMLALLREDVDLDKGEAISRYTDNKGKREKQVQLHPIVVDHLRKLVSFEEEVFPWCHDGRTLYVQFMKIQEHAGISLPCRGEHEHTPSCRVYSFHDLRRTFASVNAARLTPDTLQALMMHKSYTTTQVYLNVGRQMDQALTSLHVPDFLKTAL
jgi:integrase